MTYQEIVNALFDPACTDQDVDKMFADWRRDLARKLDDTINQAQMRNEDVVQAIDGDVTISLLAHSRNVNDVYPFRLSTSTSVKLCYKVFHVSLYEFLTGERPTIYLPRNLGAVAKALGDPTKNDRYISLYGELKAKTQTRDIWTNAPSMIFERFMELCGDRLCNFLDIINDDANKRITKPKPHKLQRAILSNATRNGSLKLPLYLAIRANIPIDYFVAPNYIAYADIVYQDWSQGTEPIVVPVKDNLVLYALSALLVMPQEEREMEIANILSLE